MVDLGQLLRRMARSDTPVAEAAGRAADLLRAVVVGNATGAAAGGARGLSVHFPPSPEWYYSDWYATVGAPVWGTFLTGYFDAGRDIPVSRRPTVDPTGSTTEYEFDDFGLTIATDFGALAVDTAVSVMLWSGVEEADGSVTFYDSTMGFIAEETTAGGVYDLTRLRLSDGEDEAWAFEQIVFNEEITFFTLTVPMWYRPPIDSSGGLFGDPIEVALIATFDANTAESTMGLFTASGEATGAFTAEPDGLLFPKVLVRDADGTESWLPSSDVGLWADQSRLSIEFVDLPAGTRLRSELRISDYGGNTATAVVSTLVP
jgi:hypothetical protein